MKFSQIAASMIKSFLEVSEIWKFHRFESFTDLKVSQIWKFHRFESFTDLKVSQNWKFHRIETFTDCRNGFSCSIEEGLDWLDNKA